MTVASPNLLDKLDPHLLGPLDGKTVLQTKRVELFVGEEEYLSEKQRRQRLELREKVRKLAELVLQKDESVLYLAPAMQVPSLLHQIGVGALVYTYHRVALLFTNQRLLEILLSYNGKVAATRVRSFPWNQAQDLKVTMSGVILKPAKGSSHKWRLQIRGDKKLLKLLVQRVRERLVTAASSEPLPLWHCPVCGFATPRHPERCTSCGTLFRSGRMATWLAIAVPGGGLFYAGYPVLGTLDLIGELFLFGIFAAFLGGVSGREGLVSALGVGAFMFLLTKLESIHLSHILVKRTKPETQEKRHLWRKVVVGGGVVSLAAVIGALGFTGRLINVVDHDLQFAAEDLGWTGSRTRSQWQLFSENRHMRSEWSHRDGSVVSVLAFPLSWQENFSNFARDYNAGRTQDGQPLAEQLVLGPLEGLRSVSHLTQEDGTPVTGIRYLIYDRKGKDVHMIIWNVLPGEASAAEGRLRTLLTRVQWISATPPRP